MGEIEMKHIAGVKITNTVLRTDKPTRQQQKFNLRKPPASWETGKVHVSANIEAKERAICMRPWYFWKDAREGGMEGRPSADIHNPKQPHLAPPNRRTENHGQKHGIEFRVKVIAETGTRSSEAIHICISAH